MGIFSMPVLIVGNTIAAIAGNSVGYFIGQRLGPRLFSNPNSRLFQPRHLERVHQFYEEHGGKTIILARFIPIVRTFVPIAAGMANMSYRKFLLWNIVGAVLWTDGILLIGYLLARQIYDAIGDKIDHYILPVVALIVLISVLPILIEIKDSLSGS